MPSLPRLALYRITLPRMTWHMPALPRLHLPRLRLPPLHLPRLRLPRLTLPQLPQLPPLPRPRLRRLAWHRPAWQLGSRLAARAGRLQLVLAGHGRRAGAGARGLAALAFARTRRTARHMGERVTAAPKSVPAARPLAGARAIRIPELPAHWKSGSFAAAGLCLCFVATGLATVEWRQSPGTPAQIQLAGLSAGDAAADEGDAPVTVALADYLASEYRVPLPLQRIAHRPAPRSTAAHGPVEPDIDAVSRRVGLPVNQRREYALNRAETAEVQVRLIRLGYSLGAPSGRLGVSTRRAIALFQRDAGLSITGTADPSTVAQIRRATSG